MFDSGNIQSRPIPNLYYVGRLDVRTWIKVLGVNVALVSVTLEMISLYSSYEYDLLNRTEAHQSDFVKWVGEPGTVIESTPFSWTVSADWDNLYVRPSVTGNDLRIEAGDSVQITLTVTGGLQGSIRASFRDPFLASTNFDIFNGWGLGTRTETITAPDRAGQIYFRLSADGETPVSVTIDEIQITKPEGSYWPNVPEASDLSASLTGADYLSVILTGQSPDTESATLSAGLTGADYLSVILTGQSPAPEPATLSAALLSADYEQVVFYGAATTTEQATLSATLTTSKYELA